jgi:hypothetical protein
VTTGPLPAVAAIAMRLLPNMTGIYKPPILLSV